MLFAIIASLFIVLEVSTPSQGTNVPVQSTCTVYMYAVLYVYMYVQYIMALTRTVLSGFATTSPRTLCMSHYLDCLGYPEAVLFLL